MKIIKIISTVLIISISLINFTSCRSVEEYQTQSINKNISIDAQIASIDAYGNLKLNILAKNIIDANFNFEDKLILQFSNGYLIESQLTMSNTNIEDNMCYIRTISEDSPITVGIKSKSLEEIGTLKIGDFVKIYQLKLN